MSKYLFIDTETGGVNPDEASLLSVGIVLWEDGKVLLEKEYYVKQESYNVSATALTINNIDIRKLNNIGLLKNEIVQNIIRIIDENFVNEKAIIAGHNIQFDIGFLKTLFSQVNENYNDYFSHRLIETSSIIRFLCDLKLLPKNIESSDKAFDYFNIRIKNRHSSLGDALGTVELYEKLMDVVRD